MNFTWLIFAHFLGDIAFQTERQHTMKGTDIYIMLSHCFIWAGVVSIGLEFLGLSAIWKWFFLIIVHGFIDKWKYDISVQYPDWRWPMYVDQGLHYLQLLVVYLI